MKLELLGLICILAAFVPFTNAQVDTNFCDVSNIISDDGQNLPLPYRNESEIYWAAIERNQQVSNAYGIEITELYDGRDNVGVAVQRAGDAEILTYSFMNADEFLFISDMGCQVMREEEALTLSPFQTFTDSQGKKHLASPLTLISSKPNIPRAYLGSNNRFVRGIPVREWRACIYSETEQSTVRITISYTNKDKWQTAFHQVPGQESVPVQIRFDHKPTSLTRPQYTEIYSIMEFKTNDLVNRAFFAIPNGVYCPGRFIKRQWPDLPTQFSFVAHLTAEQDITGRNGSVIPLRFEYDTENKLARADTYNIKKQLETVIEDFATGLTYELNRHVGSCKVTINEVDQPKDIFRLDELPRPEYLGRHYVRGISTEAWIAPRNFSGDTVLMEWHFMSSGWTTIEENGAIAGEPIAAYYYFRRPVGSEMKLVRDEYQIAHFDRTKVDYYDFDVTSCEQGPKRHLRFTVTDKERFEVMKGNPKAFREAAFFAVKQSTKVRVIRLSRLEVVFEENSAFVEFTLLEKSQLGHPTVESTNDEAYKSLQNDVSSGNLIITFMTTQNAEISVKADKNSLRDVDIRNGRYVYNYVKGKTLGTSTGVVVVLVLLFVVIGLAIGLVGGVFIIIKRVVNIPLPGPLSFFNPNFSEAESA